MLVGTQVEAEVVVMTTMTEDLVTVLLTFSKMEVATTEVVRPETNCCEASSHCPRICWRLHSTYFKQVFNATFCDVVFRRSKSIVTLTIVDDTQEERSIGQEQSVVVVIDRSIAYNSVQHKSAQCYDQFTAK